MDENGKFKQEESFKICPNNKGLLVGNAGTIKDSNTNEVLEPVCHSGDYWQIKNPMRSTKNPREYEYVHRLVALTYVPEYSCSCYVCHHKDNNKLNNLPENLLWLSPETHRKIHRNSIKRLAA